MLAYLCYGERDLQIHINIINYTSAARSIFNLISIICITPEKHANLKAFYGRIRGKKNHVPSHTLITSFHRHDLGQHNNYVSNENKEKELSYNFLVNWKWRKLQKEKNKSEIITGISV